MTASIQEVKKKHQIDLLQLPGVVSVGIGRDDDGQPAIIVGVDNDGSEIKGRVPDTLEGYVVIVRTVGTIKTQ